MNKLQEPFLEFWEHGSLVEKQRDRLRDVLGQNAWGCVNLQSRKWQSRIGASAIFIKQWRITQALNFQDNYQPSLLKQISEITFPKLKIFNLTNNLIASLEPLARINISQLSSLILTNNKVISLKSLRKLRSKLCKNICVGQNPIIEMSSCYEMDGKWVQYFIILKMSDHISENTTKDGQAGNLSLNLHMEAINLLAKIKLMDPLNSPNITNDLPSKQLITTQRVIDKKFIGF